MRNELTSQRVAAIAGRLLQQLSGVEDKTVPKCTLVVHYPDKCNCAIRYACTMVGVKPSELMAVMASALTQTADKPKRKRTKKVVK